MALPRHAPSPTLSSAAPSIIHASTSTIMQDEEESSIKFDAERDDESRFEADDNLTDPPQLT